MQTKVKLADDVNGDGTIIISSSSSSSSRRQRKKAFGLQTSLIAPETLIDELAGLGFDAAADFVTRFEAERIRRAIDRAKSHPPGKIKSLAGYIRYLVTTPGPIPAPEKPKDDKDRFIKGTYGHMVKR